MCRSKDRSSLLHAEAPGRLGTTTKGRGNLLEFHTITTAPNGLTWVASLAKAYIQPFHPGPSSQPPSLLRLGHLRATTWPRGLCGSTAAAPGMATAAVFTGTAVCAVGVQKKCLFIRLAYAAVPVPVEGRFIGRPGRRWSVGVSAGTDKSAWERT